MSRAMIAVFMLCCSQCGDCTREVSDVPYQGDAAATDPYVEAIDINYSQGGCDATGCTYFFVATAWLHNPLNESYETGVSCEFLYGNYSIGVSSRNSIVISARRSKELEFQEQFTTSDAGSVTVECSLL